MEITILCTGSRGDVQPYIALGVGLKSAGFSVKICTHHEYKNFITSYGLEFAGISGNPQDVLESEAGMALLESGSNRLKALRGIVDLMKPLIELTLIESYDVCKSSDAIICSTLSLNALHIAEKLKVPCFYAPLQPVLRTKEFPFFSIGGNIDIPVFTELFNLYSYKIAEQLLWQPIRKLVNKVRTEVLDLPPSPFWGLFHKLFTDRGNFSTILGFSPNVVKRPADWPEFFHNTGYWFLNSPKDWVPPNELSDFLESGDKPVYVGFGSMKNRKPEETTEIVINALKNANKRGIILKGWGGLEQRYSSDDIFFIDSVPHDWLFPKMAGVIHHGGAGTTAAAISAGIPSLIVPFFGDQIYWGNRIFELETGARPIPRSQLTVDTLASSIKEITNNQNMQINAFALGTKIRAEKGIEIAVKIINETILKK